MSLFQFCDLAPVEQQQPGEATFYPVKNDNPAMIQGDSKDVLKNLHYHATAAGSAHFVSHGTFSMHEVLRSFLQLAGPSSVFITTWAMSENPVRAIKSMMDDGLIKELNCLFDFKIQKNSPKALQLARGLASKIYFTHCHAKVTVIINETNGITIIGSANYTRNPRIEVGIVNMDRNLALFHREWIMKEISNTSQFKFLHESNQDTTRGD